MNYSRTNAIHKVIALLEHVRVNPGMYFDHRDFTRAQDFLRGVTLGMGVAIELNPYQEVGRETIIAARGWKYTSVSPAVEMRRKRMSTERIIDELIAIEVEAWRMLLARIESES